MKTRSEHAATGGKVSVSSVHRQDRVSNNWIGVGKTHFDYHAVQLLPITMGYLGVCGEERWECPVLWLGGRGGQHGYEEGDGEVGIGAAG